MVSLVADTETLVLLAIWLGIATAYSILLARRLRREKRSRRRALDWDSDEYGWPHAD